MLNAGKIGPRPTVRAQVLFVRAEMEAWTKSGSIAQWDTLQSKAG